MRTIPVFLSLLLLCTLTFNSCKKRDKTHSFTLNLKPSHNPDEVHIWGNTNLEGTDPSAPEIGAAAWTFDGAPVFMRAALKFDLSSIPTNAIITSAKLTLFSNHTPLNGNQTDANFGSDNTLQIQQITHPWITGAVTWLNQPVATMQNQIVVPSTSSPFLDLIDIDVSTLIKNMVANNTNYGFLIRLQSEQIYNSRIFCSSKYSDASRYPQLFIQYLH